MLNTFTDKTKDLTQTVPSDEDDSIDLGELLGIVVDGKWLVMAITFAIFSMGIIKAIIDTPIYKVDAMLQVNEKSQTMMGMEPLNDMLGNKLPVMAEIELIKSRKILGTVVKNLDLEIIAKIPFDSDVTQADLEGKSLYDFNSDSTVVQEVEKLAETLRERVLLNSSSATNVLTKPNC